MQKIGKMHHKLGLIFLLCALALGGAGAQTESSDSLNSYSKGRLVVAMGGFINSGTNDHISSVSESKQFSNSYSFDIRLAKAIVDKVTLGLWLTTKKEQSNRVVDSKRETLTLGPYASFYLGDNKSGGLYLSAAVMFANYYERNTMQVQAVNIDESASGMGLAFMGGIGYTYVMKRRVGFEVGLNYRYAYYDAKVDDKVANIVEGKDIVLTDFIFRFGFVVLFNSLKK